MVPRASVAGAVPRLGKLVSRLEPGIQQGQKRMPNIKNYGRIRRSCLVPGRRWKSDDAQSPLTHVDSKENRPKMVDVGEKKVTRRIATARTKVTLPESVLKLFESPKELQSPKGPVFTTAVIAGVNAVKKTSDLIPFCHPLPIEKIDIKIELKDDVVEIDCTVGCSHKTGVEMEALTGSSVAALCIYDMCKAMSHDIVISDTRLMAKSGGKRDFAK